MSRLITRASPMHRRVLVQWTSGDRPARWASGGKLALTLSPMEAYALADQLTEAADALLSEQPSQPGRAPGEQPEQPRQDGADDDPAEYGF